VDTWGRKRAVPDPALSGFAAGEGGWRPSLPHFGTVKDIKGTEHTVLRSDIRSPFTMVIGPLRR